MLTVASRLDLYWSPNTNMIVFCTDIASPDFPAKDINAEFFKWSAVVSGSDITIERPGWFN